MLRYCSPCSPRTALRLIESMDIKIEARTALGCARRLKLILMAAQNSKPGRSIRATALTAPSSGASSGASTGASAGGNASDTINVSDCSSVRWVQCSLEDLQ